MSVRALQSPKTFTDAWSTAFEKAVTAAAGRDGRLSRAEAARMRDSADTSVFADNAWTPFASGQKTVSVKKLIAEQTAAALAAATTAAGPDGRLSTHDAAGLSSLFRADYVALRSASPSDERTLPELRADVRDAALTALDDGTVVKLAGPPAEARGLRPLQSHIDHAASGTFFDTYVARGVVYVSRGSEQPNPLDGWYRVGPVPAKGTGRAALRGAVDAATDGLWLTSESDAHVRFVQGGAIGNQPITEQLVRERLAGAHDSLGPTLYGYADSSFVKLADRTAKPVQDGRAFLDRLSKAKDPNDPASVAQAEKWASLAKVLEGNLSDLQLYRFGTVNVSLMLVGRTKTGDLAGVLSAAVET